VVQSLEKLAGDAQAAFSQETRRFSAAEPSGVEVWHCCGSAAA
jgi:hypothetical protein